MPNKVKELAAIAVKNISDNGLHAVGGVTGLYLQIKSPNAKSWIQRVCIGTRRRDIGLGGYPEISLAKAREAARDNRTMISQGIDPVERKKELKLELERSQKKKMTFSEATHEFYSTKISKELSNEKYKKQWIKDIDRLAGPIIGDMPVADITLENITDVLTPIWMKTPTTAKRLRSRIEAVFNWAIASSHRDKENPAKWRGNLKEILPDHNKIKGKSHFPSLPVNQLPDFYSDLRDQKGMGALALQFLILTAARSNEIRFAEWDDINFEEKIWHIPGDKMKAGLDHKIPLSDEAIDFLNGIPKACKYIFPNSKSKPLSDMTISRVCKSMHVTSIETGGSGYLDPKEKRVATPHGFRSTFKDWSRKPSMYKHPVYDDDATELALAHVNNDSTRAAYARDELLEERRAIMEAWANYCINGLEP